jgi:hypothetical protein
MYVIVDPEVDQNGSLTMDSLLVHSVAQLESIRTISDLN